MAKDKNEGYTSLRDMFDGGGPGRSGDRFEGGGTLSDIGNALGGPSAIGFGDRDRDSDRSDGILGNLASPNLSPGRLAGAFVGGMALGPVGGIVGSLAGQRMAERVRAEREARLAQEERQAARRRAPAQAPLMNRVSLTPPAPPAYFAPTPGLAYPTNFADGGDVRPGFFGMLAGLGGEDAPGLFGGLGSLGRRFFGDEESGPSEDQLSALREALDAGEISRDTYETMYARLLLDDDRGDPAMGLLNLSQYALKAGEPMAPTQLSTTINRGSGGSGARALGRLGVNPLA